MVWKLVNYQDRVQADHVLWCCSQSFLPQSLMNTNKEDMRELAAQLYALVISTMTGNALQTAVHNLGKITKDNHVRHPVFIRLCAPPVLSTFHDYIFPKQSPETQHGAILALGYMVGRYMSKKNGCDSSDSTAAKGKPIKIPDDEHGDLLPMATKTIGMELQDKTLVPFSCGLSIGRVITGLLSLPAVNHHPRAPVQAPSSTAAVHC